MGLFSYQNFCLRSLASLSLIFMAGAPGWAKQESSSVRLLRGATIIDGVSDAPLVDRSILIEGNRITAIVPDGSPIAAGAEIVDLDGKVLIPGLLDSHVQQHPVIGAAALTSGALMAKQNDHPNGAQEAGCPPPGSISEAQAAGGVANIHLVG